MSKRIRADQHKCFIEADKALGPHNTAIEFAFSISDTDAYPMVRTYKVDTSKRGQPRKLIASHCPFCGDSLKQSAKQVEL
jgi:hypothetical protein